MKKAALFLVVLLASCTTYPQSMTYRPKNSGGAPYVITSKFNTLNNNLIVYIDGKEVINDTLSFLDGSGEFIGTFEGHKVNVSCRPIFTKSECTLFINAEKVGVF